METYFSDNDIHKASSGANGEIIIYLGGIGITGGS